MNILFNFMNRNAEAGFSWQNPLLYLASLVYLATPWVLFELWRQRQKMLESVRTNCEASAAFWLMLVPLALFALMSFWRSIGLHWLFSFIPLLGVLAAIVLSPTVLAKLVRWSAVFGVLHVLAMAILVSLPAQAWKDTSFSRSVALRLHARELLTHIAPYAPDLSLIHISEPTRPY